MVIQKTTEAREPRMAERLCRFIDTVSEWTGKITALLFIPFMLLVVTDVFTRYVLNKPWFYMDINIQLMGAIVVMGAAYCHLHGGHVGVDILVQHFSPRKRAILDAIISVFFFFGFGLLLWKLVGAASDSVRLLEHYTSTFLPPIYPYKVLMAVGVSLFLLQGVSQLIRNLTIAIYPSNGDYHE